MENYLFFVRENILPKKLQVLRIPGSDQMEDAITKPLASTKFLELKQKLKVTSSTCVYGEGGGGIRDIVGYTSLCYNCQG